MKNHRGLSPTFFAAILCLSLLTVPAATADTLHIGCTGTTTCTGAPPNSTTQVVTSAGNPTFQITTQKNSGLANGATGTLFLVILVPNPSSLGSSFSVNGVAGAAVDAAQFSSGKLENAGVLNFSLSGGPDVNAFKSASAQVLGGSGPGSFTLYTVNLGSVTSPPGKKGGFANGAVLATVNSFGVKLPAGTVFYAVLVSGKTGNSTLSGQTAVNDTPLSEALTASGSPTPTPEPTSMLLFGSGFVFLGGVLRRRLNSRT
jgi:PEP-CTERM motif